MVVATVCAPPPTTFADLAPVENPSTSCPPKDIPTNCSGANAGSSLLSMTLLTCRKPELLSRLKLPVGTREPSPSALPFKTTTESVSDVPSPIDCTVASTTLTVWPSATEVENAPVLGLNEVAFPPTVSTSAWGRLPSTCPETVIEPDGVSVPLVGALITTDGARLARLKWRLAVVEIVPRVVCDLSDTGTVAFRAGTAGVGTEMVRVKCLVAGSKLDARPATVTSMT